MVQINPKGDASPAQPLRTSDRLRQRPKYRSYVFYQPAIRKKIKSKKRAAATQIAKKLLRPRKPPARAPDAVALNLRRSTRKRRISINLEGYETDTTCSDDDLMTPGYRPGKSKPANNSTRTEELKTRASKKLSIANNIPRREGLRPRRSSRVQRLRPYLESEEDQESSEEQAAQHETENGNQVEEDENEEEIDGGDEADEDGDEDDDDEDDDEGEEEQEGRRRYDLRNRSEVRRMSPEKEEKQRQRSPRRVLLQGMGPKNSKYMKKGGSRLHKRPRFSLPDDSDDSLLVDDTDQGPPMPWSRSGRNSTPWFLGGLDMQGATAWGLNVAASGWAHHGDSAVIAGVQTAGPSSKGGADIQPLQLDESVSFNDIGGLSEYIDALKEMVFFPLLYPDFFANYHITPPRGVLLCGPPGTGKTLIARALASAASKAGQKVSFYMRKGADVLSKWVGEAERQLKLLFEEAQKNQPSIIFFDEIDGLAPVRSSKQEQIHNSIVSTLLALMDGLDSRGQVVLIGATNRVDAIDGALRRPGRFDREFYFPLPGYEARGEILDIHTRKWKDPPPKGLKMELAASCVGYCGADLKALCTEAAIRAFREKYPQVYTSDDKFIIDVDSVKVERYHFLEAMSTITPAAHRGAIVHSRPLSSVVLPCLKRRLEKIMEHIKEIFPFLSSSQVSKLPVFSHGSSIPLVYRPRLLICGDEMVGLDHIGPAVLHELEKFTVHSLGLPSLLSDPSAKTPEEALVHIFGEARRAVPSILYLPQFHLWWETAHEQLKAVLMTLLDELPSNLPILFLGTCSVKFSEMAEDSTSIFSARHLCEVEPPTDSDRREFFDMLFEAVLSLQREESRNRSRNKKASALLAKAPKEVAGPKASELRAKAEAEHHALRRLRMCLRDVCNRILYDKKFSVFHYPVSDEDVPDYRTIIQNPMDMVTILQRVDNGQYLTRVVFMKDIDLIVANAKAYNGNDYNGAKIVSRACELRDVVQGMLSQMDPALVSFCDKIAEQGGPMQVADDENISVFQAPPVVQAASAVTRTSARLRNVQPEVNLAQSYEVLKRQKKNNDAEQGAARDPARDDRTVTAAADGGDSSMMLSSAEPVPNGPTLEISPSRVTLVESTEPIPMSPADSDPEDDAVATNGDLADQLADIKRRLVERTRGYGVPQLERLYTRLIRGAIEVRSKGGEGSQFHRQVISHFLRFLDDDEKNMDDDRF